MGFMLGLIYDFNKELWIRIIREAVSVASDGAVLLFTVSSKPEMKFLLMPSSGQEVEGENRGQYGCGRRL
jgi:hypothetical protein